MELKMIEIKNKLMEVVKISGFGNCAECTKDHSAKEIDIVLKVGLDTLSYKIIIKWIPKLIEEIFYVYFCSTDCRDNWMKMFKSQFQLTETEYIKIKRVY